MNPLQAGYFYIPYIPLFILPKRPVEEYLEGRRQYLMQCPSAPYTCTGYCKTAAFKHEVDQKISEERASLAARGVTQV